MAYCPPSSPSTGVAEDDCGNSIISRRSQFSQKKSLSFYMEQESALDFRPDANMELHLPLPPDELDSVSVFSSGSSIIYSEPNSSPLSRKGQWYSELEERHYRIALNRETRQTLISQPIPSRRPIRRAKRASGEGTLLFGSTKATKKRGSKVSRILQRLGGPS